MRDSSLRRSVRLTNSATWSSPGAGLRNNSVKIARTCAPVTAGVFPPNRSRSVSTNHNANSDSVLW